MEINNLSVPQETKDFLQDHKFEENEFDYLNVDICSVEDGFLLNVVEWTIQNDFSLSVISSEMKEQFLASLEKFRPYLVIGQNLNSGNLIAMYTPTGEIYELEHEITDKVEAYFVNSSIEKMYACSQCYKRFWMEFIQEKNKTKFIQIFNELKEELRELDSRILMNDDEYNRQFWNTLYSSNFSFFLEKITE